VFLMAGATQRHNRIVLNAGNALDRALRDTPCVALAGQQRVFVEATGMASYPAVTVVCGPAARRVEHHRRLEPGQWLMRECERDDARLELPVLGVAITLGDLYDRADDLE
jgi:hypothetical protein